MKLELTDEEASALISIIISGRSGLRGAATVKHKNGFHNAAMRSTKIADIGDELSNRLIEAGGKLQIPLYRKDENGVDYLVSE